MEWTSLCPRSTEAAVANKHEDQELADRAVGSCWMCKSTAAAGRIRNGNVVIPLHCSSGAEEAHQI